MGLIGTVKKWLMAQSAEFFRELEVDPGAGANETAQVVFPPGIDAEGFADDYACVIDVRGRKVAIGWADTKVSPLASAGEIVIFSRTAPGVVAAKVHLKADGTILLNDSVLVTENDVIADGISLKNHTHSGDSLLTNATVGVAGPATISGNTGVAQ